jgi:GTPase Era involved in 16S rRNA processing
MDDNDKLKELMKISNPAKVLKNAIEYFNNPNVKIYVSSKKDKKYMIIGLNGKAVHFGQIGYEDYTKHNDPVRRANYLARATKIKGNWKDDPYSPNSLSINLLWM